MITSLISQLPPGTGVLCLSLAAALGWCRAHYWKGRVKGLKLSLLDLKEHCNAAVQCTSEENTWLRREIHGYQQGLKESRESQIEFLRTRLTELLPVPDSQSNWEHHAARLAIFSKELSDLREQINNPLVVSSEPDDDDLPEVTREAVDPGHDYRILDPADIIEDGDEYRDGFWHTSCRAGQTAGTEFPYRRKVSPPAAPAQPGAPDPGEGWRLLADDEEIKDGDEYQTEGHDKWFFTGKAGFTPDEVRNELKGYSMKPCCYRRRVQPAADPFSRAPEWANFRTVDEDGEVWFYQNRPKVIEGIKVWADTENPGRSSEDTSARLPAPVANWRDTLIRRPVKSNESV